MTPIRLQLLSDLHAELPGALPGALPEDLDTGADVVLLPGDIARAKNSVALAARLFPRAHIVLVAGNHEHYDTNEDIKTGILRMKLEAYEESLRSGRQVAVLEDDGLTLDVEGTAIRFLGSTLWTDFDLYGTPEHSARVVAGGLNDYAAILGEQGGRLRTAEVQHRCRTSATFLAWQLGVVEPHDGPTVVLTHHLPSARSIAAIHEGSSFNPGFASNLDFLFEDGPTLWVHGHTHFSCLWRAESGTLVACNPAGYVRGGRRENRDFDPRMVIEIGERDGVWRAEVENSTIL